MIDKRKTLGKLVKTGAFVTVMPNLWIKPIVSAVVLPAHAQSSTLNQPVLESGRWFGNSPRLFVGTTITIEAEFGDDGSDLSKTEWSIIKNGEPIGTGLGPIVLFNYMLEASDLGSIRLDLLATNEFGNSIQFFVLERIVAASEIVFSQEITSLCSAPPMDTGGFSLDDNDYYLLDDSTDPINPSFQQVSLSDSVAEFGVGRLYNAATNYVGIDVFALRPLSGRDADRTLYVNCNNGEVGPSGGSSEVFVLSSGGTVWKAEISLNGTDQGVTLASVVFRVDFSRYSEVPTEKVRF